jgi:transketolase
LALMRMIPNLIVIDPCDATDLTQATHAIANYDGPVYMRLLRGKVPVVLDPRTYRFRIGKAALLKKGRDVGIVSTGLMTEHALDAATALEARGLSAGVLHISTLKPFDGEAVREFASSVKGIVTAENHVVAGGLASQVAEALFDTGLNRPLKRVGLGDAFVELGAVPTLQARHGLTASAIINAARGIAR